MAYKINESKKKETLVHWKEFRDRVEEELELTEDGFIYSFKFKMLTINSDRVFFTFKWDNIEYGVKDICSNAITIHGKIKRESTTYKEEHSIYVIPTYFDGIDLVELLKSKELLKS